MASRGDRFLGILGLGVACGELLAYGATFAHVAVHDTYAVSFMLLGIVAFIVFCPFFLRACGALAKEPLAGLLRFVSPLPKWAITLCVVAIASALVHLGIYYEFAEYGVPRERSGKYTLETDGRIREISSDEYYAFSGHFGRAFTSELIAFSLVPALFYLCGVPRMKEVT